MSHSTKGPSGAHRWSKCTASPAFIASVEHRLPPETSSPAAEAGTRAHEVAAGIITRIMMGQRIPEDALPEDLQLLRGYLIEAHRLIQSPGWTACEYAVPLYYDRSEVGTLDLGNVDDDLVVIRDLKWGVGYVPAEGNLQMAIYAFSLIMHATHQGLNEFKSSTVIDMGIYQPNLPGDEPKLRTWVITLRELSEFLAEHVDPAVVAIMNNEGTAFHPSESTCRWYRARALCPARAGIIEEAMPVPIDREDALQALPELDVRQLTDEQILLLVKHGSAISAVVDDAWEYALERATSGTPIPGTKLVAGRAGARTWTDPKEAEATLIAAKLKEDQRYSKKLITPTQAEKLLKPLEKTRPRIWKRFTKCVMSPTLPPVLTLEDDKRPALGDPTASLPLLD